MTVGFLLTNDRAARMVAQKAVDPALPGLADVIDRIVAATFDAPAAQPVRSRDQALDSGGRRRPADRSRRDGADGAGPRDRDAEAARRSRRVRLDRP